MTALLCRQMHAPSTKTQKSNRDSNCDQSIDYYKTQVVSNVLVRTTWQTGNLIRGIIGVHNIFVNPELRWKPRSVNTIFSWIKI